MFVIISTICMDGIWMLFYELQVAGEEKSSGHPTHQRAALKTGLRPITFNLQAFSLQHLVPRGGLPTVEQEMKVARRPNASGFCGTFSCSTPFYQPGQPMSAEPGVMKMKLIALSAALLAASVVIAQSQTAPAPTAPAPTVPGATSTTSPLPTPQPNTDTNAPLPGANSFTEMQVKGRLEEKGFTNVAGLKKDDNGIWRGTAMQSGKQVNVAVDYRGNIVAN